jgi:hypothetical protein
MTYGTVHHLLLLIVPVFNDPEGPVFSVIIRHFGNKELK